LLLTCSSPTRPNPPPPRRPQVLGWVKEGVRDFSISRANVEWGIRVPQDPSHTVYVWFDALNGEASGLGGGEGWLQGPAAGATLGWRVAWVLPHRRCLSLSL
jgi:methionyl-tRNA synthetase